MGRFHLDRVLLSPPPLLPTTLLWLSECVYPLRSSFSSFPLSLESARPLRSLLRVPSLTFPTEILYPSRRARRRLPLRAAAGKKYAWKSSKRDEFAGTRKTLARFSLDSPPGRLSLSRANDLFVAPAAIGRAILPPGGYRRRVRYTIGTANRELIRGASFRGTIDVC